MNPQERQWVWENTYHRAERWMIPGDSPDYQRQQLSSGAGMLSDGVVSSAKGVV